VSSFLSPIRAEDLEDGYTRRLLEDVVYHVGSPKSTDKIVVPAGTIWDGGSVPQIFWNVVSPWGRASKAYLLHDHLYATQERSRLVSDAILMEAMEVLGVNYFQRKAVYQCVRLFGFVAWNSHSKKLKRNLHGDAD
jgi:hypothetical protein